MKKTLLTLALAAFAATSSFVAGEIFAEPAADTPPPPPPAPKPLTAEQRAKALNALGWLLSKGEALNTPLEQFGFSDADLDTLLAGFRRGAKGEGDEDFGDEVNKLFPQITQVLSEGATANKAKWEAKTKLMQEKAKAAIEKMKKRDKDYLAKVDKEGGYTTTASGLRYKVLVPGTPSKPIATSNVKALYTGKLVDGTVFDSTSKRGNEPAEFNLSQVIPGWTEGLQKVGKGGQVLLVIPSEIGYGERGSSGAIPPYATLLFEVELVDFSNEPAAPAVAPAPAAAPAPAGK